MKLFPLRTVLTCTAIFVGALTTGCGGDDDLAEVKDAGIPADTGVVEATDAGIADTGIRRDSGVAVTDNTEGYECTPSESSAQGSCLVAGNECVNFADGFEADNAVIARCVIPCTVDADCATSLSGPLCRSTFLDSKSCVAAEVGEGRTANATQVNGESTGCTSPLVALPRTAFSALFELETDQTSCARRCVDDNGCTTTGIGVCLTDLFTPTAFDDPAPGLGMCVASRAGKGARCSTLSVTGICDPEGGNLVCLDLGLYAADNVPVDAEFGTCLDLCTIGMPRTCTGTASPGLVETCRGGFLNSTVTGICTDNCTAFPDNCTGPGSPAAEGQTANGIACRPLFTQTEEFALCLDVNQASTPFPLYSFVGNPAVDCATNPSQCPDKSDCIAVSQGPTRSGCVRGCTTATTAQNPNTGCEGITEIAGVICNAAINTSTGAEGFCAPPGGG